MKALLQQINEEKPNHKIFLVKKIKYFKKKYDCIENFVVKPNLTFETLIVK